MATALAFESVSKTYAGAHQASSLRDIVAGVGGALIGRRRKPPEIKALDNVSFEVPIGESFALVGNNGAGKTTSLKIATRVVHPTGGVIRVRGRVGALIEVGTGLHPELTGHENIDLYGRILGLSKADITRHLDEIIEFASIGDAIYQPVKQYSSGMQLRLGFAIAAHLEPDVLIVDEAIAVGDAGFQYKCVDRMSRLVREGRTLIFVSHDLSAVENLCTRAVLLERGRISLDGPARDVVRAYLAKVHKEIAAEGVDRVDGRDDQLEILGVTLLGRNGEETEDARTGEALTIRLHYFARDRIQRPMFSVGISEGRPLPLALASMLADGQAPAYINGEGSIDCTFENLPLQPRAYEIWASVRGASGFGDLIEWQRVRRFEVSGEILGGGGGTVSTAMMAPVIIPYQWKIAGETPLSSANGSDESTLSDHA